MGELRFGPARVLSRDSPSEAIDLLRERSYTANEIDFASGFWMDYAWAEEFGKLARRRKVVLSVHAPIAGFMGHLERDNEKHPVCSAFRTPRRNAPNPESDSVGCQGIGVPKE